MSKRFPFGKRTIKALSPHDNDSRSRETETFNAEGIGPKLRVSKGGRTKGRLAIVASVRHLPAFQHHY